MSTHGYVKHLQEATKRAPSKSFEVDTDFDFGPQSTDPLALQDFGDKYKLLKLDINELDDFVFDKSGKGPGTLNQSVVIYGRPGVGKSAIVRMIAQRVAKETGRTFVDFNNVYSSNKGEMVEIFKNPEKYYCFIDIRAGAYEAFEFKGIPKASTKIRGTAESLDMLWIKILTVDDSAGLLFLDEINQASPETQNVMYGLLHFNERIIAEKGIRNASYWAVHAAGNLGSQYAGTNELNKALVNRVSIVYFDVTYDAWFEFAQTFMKTLPNGAERKVFHPLILKFLNYVKTTYPDKIDRFFAWEDPTNVRQGDPNPRNFEKLSESIYAIVNKYKAKQATGGKTSGFVQDVGRAAASDINTPWAEEFYQYLEIKEKNNIDRMLAAPGQYFTVKTDENPAGTNKKEFFTNLSLLQDKINGFLPEYLDAVGYGPYMNSERSILKDTNEKQLPAIPEDVDVEAYNAYVLTFFGVIDALVKAKQSQHAAIILSFMRDAKYRKADLWSIFKIAIVNTMDKKHQASVKEFLSTTAKDLEAIVKSAQGSLNKMKKETKFVSMEDEEGFHSEIDPDGDEDEEGDEDAEDVTDEGDIDLTNRLVQQALARLDKIEPLLHD